MGLYVLDDEAIERLPERGDHETTTFPELAAEGRLLAFRHEGLWLTVNTPKGPAAAEEHFATQPVGVGSSDADLESPNLNSIEAWEFEPRRVDKPWGYELIWAHTDLYVGKVLFVRTGHSLSLQFHREKDESWYVQSGRAKLELGEAGAGVLNEEVITGRRLPLHARHRAPRDGPRGHDDPGGLDAAPRRRRPARGRLRPRGHVRTLVCGSEPLTLTRLC